MPKVETAQKLPIFCVYAFLCVLNIVLYLFYSFPLTVVEKMYAENASVFFSSKKGQQARRQRKL